MTVTFWDNGVRAIIIAKAIVRQSERSTRFRLRNGGAITIQNTNIISVEV